jgi:hypothetical protein
LKKLFLYILLTIALTDTTSLYQVLKLPSLVRHYTEHKALNPAIGVMDFLSMHYWGQDIDDNDDEKDMQLPFKKFEIQHVVFIPLQSSGTFCFRTAIWLVKADFGPDRPQLHAQTSSGSLFRPPQG